jgi:hypothetical protein
VLYHLSHSASPASTVLEEGAANNNRWGTRKAWYLESNVYKKGYYKEWSKGLNATEFKIIRTRSASWIEQ